MKTISVSVITPCYNAAATIGETIQSVIRQTFSDWEMLIVDDCSTDNSADIIKQFSEKDERVKYYRTNQPSGSPSLPRNIAINKAKGKYIAFLDADDIWLPEKLEKQIPFMEKMNVDFCYSDYEKMDYLGNRNNRILKMPPKATYWDVIESCVIPCLTVIIRRDIINKTQFKNINKEDWVFWMDILKKKIIAINCGENLAIYREQKHSRSSNKLQMIHQQWKILRYEEWVKRPLALYFMFKYLLRGFIKYLK